MSTEIIDMQHRRNDHSHPCNNATLSVTVDQGQPEIDIQCTDAFGHQKQQNIQLNWEPLRRRWLFGGLPPMVLAGGAL